MPNTPFWHFWGLVIAEYSRNKLLTGEDVYQFYARTMGHAGLNPVHAISSGARAFCRRWHTRTLN
jgi:hypothetical protein